MVISLLDQVLLCVDYAYALLSFVTQKFGLWSSAVVIVAAAAWFCNLI